MEAGSASRTRAKAEPSLPAPRHALRPVVDLVEIGREMAEPDLVEHLDQPLPLDPRAVIGIGQGIAQIAERNVGFLREKEGATRIEMDLAASERPDPGDGAQQRALAGARRAGDETRIPL